MKKVYAQGDTVKVEEKKKLALSHCLSVCRLNQPNSTNFISRRLHLSFYFGSFNSFTGIVHLSHNSVTAKKMHNKMFQSKKKQTVQLEREHRRQKVRHAKH